LTGKDLETEEHDFTNTSDTLALVLVRVLELGTAQNGALSLLSHTVSLEIDSYNSIIETSI